MPVAVLFPVRGGAARGNRVGQPGVRERHSPQHRVPLPAASGGRTAADRRRSAGQVWDRWRERDPDEIQFGRDENTESLGQVADRVLAAFHTSEVARPVGRIVGVEQELRGRLVQGCPDLLARVDLLIETDHELVVTDVKTSRSRWTAMQADESAEQLLLYSELAGALVPGKQMKLEFAVLTKRKTPAVDRLPVAFSPRRVERTKRIVERGWHAMQSGHFYPVPSPLRCATCTYRGPCRAWDG